MISQLSLPHCHSQISDRGDSPLKDQTSESQMVQDRGCMEDVGAHSTPLQQCQQLSRALYAALHCHGAK